MASICCSIEMEPKTLSLGQLNHAREVAADVVQKMEPSEASNVFIEGMRPVVLIRQMESSAIETDHNGKPPVDHKAVENLKRTTAPLERPCKCQCNGTPGPDNYVDAFKEPLSAPF